MSHPIASVRLVVALLVVLTMVGFVPAQPSQAQSEQRCFAETNQCISGPIRQYWERNGGLAVFGFPITAQSAEQVEGQALQVQWFERDRLEIQANGQVTAGRLGVERLAQQGTPWQFGPGEAADAGCLAFAETGHRVCGAFATYWERNGGLARFGFPVTGAYETEIEGMRLTVQYFERRRFELHDANTVLLGLLGSEVLRERGELPASIPLPERPEVVGRWVYMQDYQCNGSFDGAHDVVFHANGQAHSFNYLYPVIGPWFEIDDKLYVDIFADGGTYEFIRTGRGFTTQIEDFCLELRPALAGLTMPNGQMFSQAFTLSDGTILSLGGDMMSATKEVVQSSTGAFRYDPRSRQWASIGELGTGRARAAMVMLADERILIVGGLPASDNEPALGADNRVMLFDPANGTSTATTDIGYEAAGYGSVLLENGHVLVSGGSVSDDAGQTVAYNKLMRYDPQSEQWAEMAPMAINRVSHRMTLLNDGRVLVTGGLYWDSAANQYDNLASVTIYDPANDRWEDVPSMQHARQLHSAVRLADGRVLIVGGFTDMEVGTNVNAEIYDPASNTWADAGLPIGDHSGGSSALLLPDGQVLVIGGGYYFEANSRAVSRYDPATNAWSALSPLQLERSMHRASLLPDGQVLIIGGSSANLGTPSSHEIYDLRGGGSSVMVP
ncbi:Kelch repeat-containing protein [Candidatus Viridilinea mediisalina]|uniref:Attractin/MKLN-like beta-propeller domain-containing protein n=1 Tax=Candidatus Viridilinea mediisalina TaxID=2024553 RepID=A0A2A6RJR8_9CHLR|nr:kelch repeat-containing protein [Candidatus Viridilinea mediisalina]PDW03262.1 hypothetical protein CJ255_09770 [Candidatus Viridilinea mediisalina]